MRLLLFDEAEETIALFVHPLLHSSPTLLPKSVLTQQE